MRLSTLHVYLLLFSAPIFAQTPNYPYVLKNYAGVFPLGDGGLATAALLYYPNAVIPDPAGNLLILDAANSRIRKVAPDGKISTFATIGIYGYDMKRGADGTLYVSGVGQVIKVSPAGVSTVIAGTGDFGFAGDGGPAASAQVGDAYGVAVDAAGNVYFSDVSPGSHRVREVTTDGRIRTIAGAGAPGFNGNNQQATAAALYNPSGIAIDSTGAIYVADYSNIIIRRFTVGGLMSTFAGNGNLGPAVNGPATASRLGTPNGLYIDSADNVYFTDTFFCLALKVTPSGAISILAGNGSPYSKPEDGDAISVSLRFPNSLSADAAGNVLIVENTHRVRRVSSDGKLVTIAGRLHFAGDNGPAASALLNEPTDLAFDATGNVLIADAGNYLIRKVTPAGIISTYAGKLNPAPPVNGANIFNLQLPYINAITFDSKGAMYLAGNVQIYKVTPDGILNIIAGTGSSGDTGDGGRAAAATFVGISGIAVNAAGTVYVADAGANRVRSIAADTGIITAFAGFGGRGRTGDGALATGATLNLSSGGALATDQKGNVYIADGGNYSVRRVDSSGLINTIVGNGSFGHADNVQATSTGFSRPAGLAVDGDGNLYISSKNFGEIYKLSGGVLRRVSGNGNSPLVDGTPALSSYFFSQNIKLDANGDIYSVDLATSTVRKLILNSPSALVVSDGDKQTAQTGQPLPKILKVQLNGRAGVGVAGVTVNFVVTSGTARLSSATTLTDSTGVAGVSLTLGSNAGPVTVTATAAGTTLAPAQFTATATAPVPTCAVPQPAIVSVRSAGDFGGSTTFASGSWIEIKGGNLAGTTRSWAGDDFDGNNAPTALDGVTVTINGKRAFIGYISPVQINVQAPADAATGPLDLTVSTASCASGTISAQKAAVAGGLLAPSSFNIGGKQYVAGLFQDGFTFIGNTGLIPGVPFRPAAPGDSITLYGIGFGDVTPSIPPGVIAAGRTSIPDLTIAFGTTPAVVSYAGLAPNAVGLYEFNVTVPDVPDGDYPVAVRIGSTAISQTAYLTVHR